jgi:hypothetical protein
MQTRQNKAICGYARASTLKHLNVLGRYAFTLPELVALRTAPSQALW